MTYAYLRVSTDKQDGQNQRIGVDALAKARGLVIDEYIDDEGVSGMKEPEKRELGKLMKKLKPGDIIIAGELSRLGRSLFMIFRILEFCLNNGVTVMTAKDGYTLGNDIQSKVLAFAFGMSAEIERDMISRRTKEALARLKAEGKSIGGSITGKRKRLNPICERNRDWIHQQLDERLPKTEIATKLGVSRGTFYRYLVYAGIYKPEKYNKDSMCGKKWAEHRIYH